MDAGDRPITIVTGASRGIGAAAAVRLARAGCADRVAAPVPLGRAGEPDEIAPAITWLLSAEAAYMTGAVLRIAGGL